MAIFPDIAPDYGYSLIPIFRTDRLGPTDGDYTQRRRRRSTPLYAATLQYSSLSAANERTLLEFFEARYGAWESFTFFDFVSRVYPVTSIGTGDGSTTTWTLDCRDVTDMTVYFDDVEQSSSVYSISNRTGTGGQDQLVFDPAPSNTIIITAQYSGKKYLPDCLFDEDQLASTLVTWNRHSLNTIKLSQYSG